jgi:Tol biopolymer transport system component
MTYAVSGRGPVYERSVEWSPDGKWVAVSGANNPMRLLRWPPAQGGPGEVRELAGGEPDWSPDNRTIVYAETLNGALSIYYVIESGATPFRTEPQYVGTGMGEYAQGPGPRWSPASMGADGDLIAYRSRSPQGEPRVSIRRRGGRELSPLPSLTNNPSWSPSGDRLVVESGYVKMDLLGPKWEPNGLSIAKVNLSGEHEVTPLVKDAWWPAWGK